MKLKEFDYHLPKNLIAQKPIKPRDHSRLLIVKKFNKVTELLQKASFCSNSVTLKHKHFYDIVDYLQKGDVLVLNNSKVFPARLIGKKFETGGRIEVFLHRKIRGSLWQCLLGGRGIKENLEIEFYNHNRNRRNEALPRSAPSCSALPCLECKVVKNNRDGTWDVKFNKNNKQMMGIVNKIGKMPLPPYIKRPSYAKASEGRMDSANYQTVYANEKKIGSVAAPTAGFHFTPNLIKKLKNKGVQFEYITLHVGLGTFAPVKVDDITKHKMHAEWVEASRETIARIYLAKYQKRRIIAVGTTSVRTLEAIVSQFPISNFQFPNRFQFSITKYAKQFPNFKNYVNIFIYPGYKFKIIDAMITNFHLPKSTLLMLVSAFACTERSRSAGKENIDKTYKSAVKHKYRFYSYGDSMFIY